MPRRFTRAPCPPSPCRQGRASRIMLNGVSVARRTFAKPPAVMTSRSFASPAWCAERRTNLLGQGGRHADHRRGGIEQPAHRVEVLLDAVAGHRLDDHPRTIRLERAADMSGRAGRIAHIVQAVEEGYPGPEPVAESILRRAHFKTDILEHVTCESAPVRRGRLDRAVRWKS